MSVSPNTQAVLLLTAHFSKSSGGTAKPLTPKEWGRFAVWLKDHALTPEQLMMNQPKDLLEGWSDRQITLERLESLLNRGSALAIAMEKWLRAGLWVMTRADKDYPSRLKRRLGTDSPAVLYGCGNRSLLNSGGLAVIGSRKAAEDDLDYTRRIGAAAASQGYSIVSGGARGVDETAMLAALEKEGTAVGVLADSLLRACSSSKYRRHLLAKNLVLISTFHPEAGFSAGNAMQRNKYIYCLSDAALVVHSGVKGGTWSGATENLKKCWVPLWIKPTRDTPAGNDALVKQGAKWVSEDTNQLNVEDLWHTRDVSASENEDLLSIKEAKSESSAPREEEPPEGNDGTLKAGSERDLQEPEPSPVTPASTVNEPAQSEAKVSTATPETDRVAPIAPSLTESHPQDESVTFYVLFLQKISSACAASAKTPDELAELFDVNKTQVNAWLKRAHTEKKVRKLSKPVRYVWIDVQQTSLFES